LIEPTSLYVILNLVLLVKYMSTLTRKGQVTIPKEVREALGARPGDRVEFIVEDESVKLIKVEEDDDPIAGAVGLFEDVESWRGKSNEELMKELRGR